MHLTLDSFAFCTAYGLEISLNKTKIMQFLPTRRRGQPAPVRHAFALGSYDLETVDVYKYLGVSFCCSGNPAYYMPVALRNLEYSARRLKQQYGGMACTVVVAPRGTKKGSAQRYRPLVLLHPTIWSTLC